LIDFMILLLFVLSGAARPRLSCRRWSAGRGRVRICKDRNGLSAEASA
jgi:hypothetical protein